MIKTELFSNSAKALGALKKYQDFISKNQDIVIISVNILEHDWILLTYCVK